MAAGQGSKGHRKPGMAGEVALASVEREKMRGPHLHGGGDVEDIVSP